MPESESDVDYPALAEVTVGNRYRVTYTTPHSDDPQVVEGEALDKGRVPMDDYVPQGSPWVMLENSEDDDRDIVVWFDWDMVRSVEREEYPEDDGQNIGDVVSFEEYPRGED